jgi:tRNA(Ile)-lysidine synthase
VFQRFKQHIQESFPFLEKSKLLIAISGGIDSVVLTHLFQQLGYTIALAHVNFKLRNEESNQDEIFVNSIGKNYNIPVFVYQSDTKAYAQKHKLSIQMAAREIRYRFFEQLLKEKEYDYLLTAHHLDDNIETFFINLSRNSGLEGLTGIPILNKATVRPLLSFSRANIITYATQNHLKWREDQSNASTKYLRNKIRHHLLPVLKDTFPNFENSFVKTQSHLSESKDLVNDYIDFVKTKIWNKQKDQVFLSIKEIKNLPHYRAVLYEMLKKYAFTEWDDVYNLLEAQTGKQVFSNTHYLLKDRENLVLGVSKQIHNLRFEIHDTKFEIDDLRFEIQNLKFEIDDLEFKTKDIYAVRFDKSKVNFPLFVRKWQKGDYFYPLGMRGKKKLSDFFTDLKLSHIEKKKIWLLCDADDQIIWIIGKRLDNRFKISKQTTELIKIKPIKPKNN